LGLKKAFKAAFDSVEKLAVTGKALRSAVALGFRRAESVRILVFCFFTSPF